MSTTSPTTPAPAQARETDAEVAEKIFGWLWYDHGTSDRPRRSLIPRAGAYPDLRDERGIKDVPHYSTEKSAAWEVVEAMRARGFKFELSDRHGEPGKEYWAEFATEDYDKGAQAWEATMQLAICVAALATHSASEADRTATKGEA